MHIWSRIIIHHYKYRFRLNCLFIQPLGAVGWSLSFFFGLQDFFVPSIFISVSLLYYVSSFPTCIAVSQSYYLAVSLKKIFDNYFFIRVMLGDWSVALRNDYDNVTENFL